MDKTIGPALGGVRIREATTGLLDRFLGAVTSQTRRKWARVILTGMFALAARHDAVDRNPVRETTAPRATTSRPRALTLAEVQQLRTNITSWQESQETGRPRGVDLVQIVDVTLGTGLRIGEVLALRWADINQTATPPTLTVVGTVVLVGEQFVRQDRPKTDAGRRTIVLPEFVVTALSIQRDRGWDAISELVFPAHNGAVRSPHNVRRALRAARGELDWVSPHTLRKTAATFVDEMHGTGAAAHLLGHSGTAVTEKHYIHRAALAPDVSSALDRLAPKPQSAP
ncbi:MAG: tyrosine-type recombinase/integrase [Nocardiaceae bacterium]|nr:tyrosine-type recombinase/integrase [Nocardiaceae bacterium]